MNKYKFLLKPVFFVFNLVFATWLVFKVESISPSNFGKYKSLFDEPPTGIPGKIQHKKYLVKICADYKAGKLDTLQLNTKLEEYLTSAKMQVPIE